MENELSIKLLKLAALRPDLPRLWDGKGPIEIKGSAWKFKCFQHWNEPLWVEFYSPSGRRCERSILNVCWQARGQKLGYNEYGEDVILTTNEKNDFTYAEAEEAVRLFVEQQMQVVS